MDGLGGLNGIAPQVSRERLVGRQAAKALKGNSTVRASFKLLHSPDVPDLTTWMLDAEAVFGLLLEALIGPSDGKGAESFNILVCSPRWLERDMASTGIRSGEHLLLMTRYDRRLLLRYLERRVHSCEAPTWSELAQQLSRLGAWEFNGYRPSASVPAAL